MSNVPIFIINLEKDAIKRAHMEELCKNNRIEPIFIDAVYGKDLDQKTIENVYNKDTAIKEFGRELTFGEIGCTLSHVKIYQKMFDENIKQAIIFEDDVSLTPQFTELLDNIKNFPSDYELMLLGHYADVETEEITSFNIWSKYKITEKLNSIRLVRPTYGTHGYIINLSGAQKLLSELKLIKKPIDHYTGRENYLNMYAIQQRVVLLDPSCKAMSSIEAERKDIENGNNVKHKIGYTDKKNPFIKSILRKFRLFEIGRTLYTTYKQLKILKRYT